MSNPIDNSYPARFGRLEFHYQTLYRAMERVMQAQTLDDAKLIAKIAIECGETQHDELVADNALILAGQWRAERAAQPTVPSQRVALGA